MAWTWAWAFSGDLTLYRSRVNLLISTRLYGPAKPQQRLAPSESLTIPIPPPTGLEIVDSVHTTVSNHGGRLPFRSSDGPRL